MAQGPRTTEKTGGDGRPPTLKSLTRALRLLRVLERSPHGLGLAELSRENGLPKSTTLRLLRSFVHIGVLTRDDTTGRYLWGPALWIRLVPFLTPAHSLIADVTAVLDDLSSREGASALLLLPDEKRRRATFPLYSCAQGPLIVEPSAGPSVPLHALASGKCYLAYLSEQQLADYLRGGLERLTEKTIVSPSRLRRELAAVRRRGYGFNLGEIELGLPGIGVPVRDGDGSVVGGLSLAYAKGGFTRSYLTARVPTLRSASKAISGLLSYDSFRKYMKEGEQTAPPPLPEPEAARALSDQSCPALVRSVFRAMRLMAVLWHSREGEPASALARQRGLDRASVTRLLRTLEAEGMVHRDSSSGRYYTSPTLWLRLAPLLRTSASVESIIHTVLGRLAHHSGATALLVCPDSANRRAIACAYAVPERHVFFRPDAGFFPLLHSLAAGKCCLAYGPDSALAAYLHAGLRAQTEQTIAIPATLERELSAVRDQGYALSREECVRGIGGIAVPIARDSGELLAAVALAPVIREFTPDNIDRWLPQLRVVADTLSHVLAPHGQQQLRSLRARHHSAIGLDA